MGWFGMPHHTRQTAFETLFSQRQYQHKFELLWEKHMKNKSIAVYTLDDKVFGETILWREGEKELMYKPISWIDSAGHIPKRLIKRLLENSSNMEKSCYEPSKGV